ncbi:MAG: glycosyl hydrolase, partial [Saprospiraceae bacterium]|nr:glycosyl hydrolase [Saprospiraceae bacterium]
MLIDLELTPQDLAKSLDQLWKLSAAKIRNIANRYQDAGAPVFTIEGKYTSRGWTEWTQGFQYGSAILQFDATGEEEFLGYGRTATLEKMADHVSHFGVHDHGFNNVSTYGNLLRLMHEGRIPHQEWEKAFYELAIKISGAVQARRWTKIPGGGFIYSFNGPHSLFVDTIRTIRVLVLAHELGHVFSGENDSKISLLGRAIHHAAATAKYSVFYGDGKDQYDVWGRTAHEAIFNTNDGAFRCPNAQQGFSGFSTWTRGLAWAVCGFAEQLEYLEAASPAAIEDYGGLNVVRELYLKAAKATADFYIEHTSSDGIPYWDTGAPDLHKLGDYTKSPADPYNAYEPVDSSAAAITAQGLLRLGRFLGKMKAEDYSKYWQAGLSVARTLLKEPYLSTDEKHEGLLLHSIYHRPNNWDHIR